VTVIGDETTHGSDLRGSRLSVLETIAPSETVLDPIPEDDDPDVGHWGWRPEIETARRACGYADGGRPGRRWRRCSV
jgi:hypothetical protein